MNDQVIDRIIYQTDSNSKRIEGIIGKVNNIDSSTFSAKIESNNRITRLEEEVKKLKEEMKDFKENYYKYLFENPLLNKNEVQN